MALPTGLKQEEFLFDYLRYRSLCLEVVKGDTEVRRFLGLAPHHKCADAIGLHKPLGSPGPKRVTVAESKGSDINSAVTQLGNAAAGVYKRFGPATNIQLLLLVPKLDSRPGGHLSPGPGFRAIPLKTGLGKYRLFESMGGAPFPARPLVSCDDDTIRAWSSKVALLKITVLLLAENPPAHPPR